MDHGTHEHDTHGNDTHAHDTHAHDTHAHGAHGHDAHGHGSHGHSTENKAIISFGNGFWLVAILVGLFIAALNFVQAESGAEEGHGGHGAATHEAHGGGAAGHDDVHDATPKNEVHEGEAAHDADAPTVPVGEGAHEPDAAPAEHH